MRVTRLFLAIIVAATSLYTARVEAATHFAADLDRTSVFAGQQFVITLRGDFGTDQLLSLDPVVEFDSARLIFTGYQTTGTMTGQFDIFPDLGDLAISLLQDGTLSTPASGILLKAQFGVRTNAIEGPTEVRLYGNAGLDLAGDAPFSLPLQVTVSAVPEPAAWILMGLGVLLTVSRKAWRQIRSLEAPLLGANCHHIGV